MLPLSYALSTKKYFAAGMRLHASLLTHSINHALRSSSDRFVMFRQQFCENWKVVHRILRIWIRIKIGD